jgi:hypothetical protein
MLTKKFRQSIVAERSLSTYAHNVKIITKDGMVTLKGRVHSEDEKSAIASKAAGVALQLQRNSHDGRLREVSTTLMLALPYAVRADVAFSVGTDLCTLVVRDSIPDAPGMPGRCLQVALDGTVRF